jgi:hypothetical protein
MKIPFDLKRFGEGNVVTQDGKSVMIFKTDARGPYPIIGTIREIDRDIATSWTVDGRYNTSSVSSYDLFIQLKDIEPVWERNYLTTTHKEQFLIYIYEDHPSLRTSEFREELYQLVKKYLNK